MKTMGILVLAIIIAVGYFLYLNHQQQTQTYAFCSQFSSGNRMSTLEQQAQEQGYEQLESDNPNITLFGQTPGLPLVTAFACEVTHHNGRVTDLAVVKL